MSVRRSACCWFNLHATLFRLLCVLLPAGFPARSVDVQRATDNITVRQGDTAVIREEHDDAICHPNVVVSSGNSPGRTISSYKPPENLITIIRAERGKWKAVKYLNVLRVSESFTPRTRDKNSWHEFLTEVIRIMRPAAKHKPQQREERLEDANEHRQVRENRNILIVALKNEFFQKNQEHSDKNTADVIAPCLAAEASLSWGKIDWFRKRHGDANDTAVWLCTAQLDTHTKRCYVDDKVSKVAWLNRSNIIFASEDKWSLDPRVDLVTKGQLEYSLRIQKVDVYDEGSYTCSIQTKHQSKTSQVYLIVQVPAYIYKVSEDITVNEGSNVTLSCLANGRPDPSITWRLLNPSAETLDVGEYLEISGIMRTQAGRYECKASNDVATPDVKYVNVIVNYPPFIKVAKSSETVVGRQGVLKCDATAVPKPEFEWYKDDKRLSNMQGIGIHIVGSRTELVVANVTEDDYGNYTCVATNRLGMHNASVFLYRPGTGRDINGSTSVCQPEWLLLLLLLLLPLLKC
ncbi:Limbic system-associated membrane protein [Bagarius yarrelli]|uniref:Limbic system-associated membrane protein n=1 Tax=Bagarius yarrelli TaxID=175774 RepID=A0A556TTT2_BAGYA|nr:Limbic system-associated membrane protein [Bagarius yarrelli]